MSTDRLVTDLVTLARNGGKQAWGIQVSVNSGLRR